MAHSIPSPSLPEFYQGLWTPEAPRYLPPVWRVYAGMYAEDDSYRRNFTISLPTLHGRARWHSELQAEDGRILAEGYGLSQDEAEATAALSYVMGQGISPRALLVTFHAQAALTDDPPVAW